MYSEEEHPEIRPIDKFYLSKEEPLLSCLQVLRELILGLNEHMTEAWRYRIPFFCYKGIPCCYLWVHKKFNKPYIGFVEGQSLEHPELLPEDRKQMKILLIDPEADLDLDTIEQLLADMIRLVEENEQTKP